MDELLEMRLECFITICESLGIDSKLHADLIEDMYQDGFCPAEVAEAIEVYDPDGEFSHMKEYPYA